MKKLLLIGDSVRMNYQPGVVKQLNNIVSVSAPQDSARFAKYTLWYIREWLGTYGTPDIIHWNNGMWDVYRFEGETTPFSKLEEYIESISKIYEIMKQSGAKIIFATTTPVAENNINAKNDEIDLYNKAALSVLSGKDIVINDLNALLRGNTDKYICDDLMHLSQEGISLCGSAIGDIVKKLL